MFNIITFTILLIYFCFIQYEYTKAYFTIGLEKYAKSLKLKMPVWTYKVIMIINPSLIVLCISELIKIWRSR
jgi:hypothetical protein